MDKEKVLERIINLKNSQFGDLIIKSKLKELNFELYLLTADQKDNKQIIELLTKWRKMNEIWFRATFETSYKNTKNWYLNNLINVPDRLLFLIKVRDEYVGHVGLFRFDFQNCNCEIDNIIRGSDLLPGVMHAAIEAMLNWARYEFSLTNFRLQTTSDNSKALRLYTSLGFVEICRQPLIPVPYDRQYVKWIPTVKSIHREIKRYNVRMALKNI